VLDEPNSDLDANVDQPDSSFGVVLGDWLQGGQSLITARHDQFRQLAHDIGLRGPAGEPWDWIAGLVLAHGVQSGAGVVTKVTEP